MWVTLVNCGGVRLTLPSLWITVPERMEAINITPLHCGGAIFEKCIFSLEI
jgi:hypothetical protein